MSRHPTLDPPTRGWVLLSAALALLPLLLQLPAPLAIGYAISAVIVAALSWHRPVPMPLRLLLVAAMLLAIY